MATIRCSVNSCHYWSEGEYCTADEIWVKNQMTGDVDDDIMKKKTRMEIGTIGGNGENNMKKNERGTEGGEKSAQKSSQTCCETFRPKGTTKMS